MCPVGAAMASLTYGSQERFGDESGSRIQLYAVRNCHSRRIKSGETYEELHFRDLLINLLHELDNKVDQLVLQHLLGVEVRNQE